MNGNLEATIALLRQSMDFFPKQWRELLVRVDSIDEFPAPLKERLALQRAFYIGDLAVKTQHDLETAGKNRGLQKPMTQVVRTYLQDRNLNLGMSIPEWPKHYDMLHAALPTLFAEGIKFSAPISLKRGVKLSKNEILLRLLLTQAETAPLKPRQKLLFKRLARASCRL
jgi:hypothetical protein